MHNPQILISIIIPLYNKELYFKQCFISVTKQTYKNIECIIVEDCSSDNSLKLAESLIMDYKGNIKFVLLEHKQNKGLSVARNTGINNANGEYVYFLDSDDEITDNCINSLVMLAGKYPETDIVQGNIIRRSIIDNSIYEAKFKLPEFVKGNSIIKKKYSKYFPKTSWNKLIRKKFVTDNYLYFKAGLIHEDILWFFFVMKKVETVSYTDEYCYIHNVVPDSIMQQQNLIPSILGCLTAYEEMLHNLDTDLLEYQLLKIRKDIKQQKKKILSDERYLHLLPRYKALLAKTPNGIFFLFIYFRYYILKIMEIVKGKINDA